MRKILALFVSLLIPTLLFAQPYMEGEKPTLNGRTGIQLVVTGTGEIRFVVSADTAAKGFYIDSSTGALIPVSAGAIDIGSTTLAVDELFANNVQAATGQNLSLKARNGNVDIYGIGSDAAPVRVWRFLNTGILSQDATNGGSIVFNTTNHGVMDGIAAYPADVTAVTGTAPTLLSLKNVSNDASHVALMAIGANTNGAELDFFKSRATDGTADTIVASGDDIVSIGFLGADGAAFRRAATISAAVDGTPGASDMPGRLVFSVTADGAASPTEAFRISNDLAGLFAGTVRSSRTTDIGWSFVDATDNQACNTGCTSACVFGIANATGTAVTALLGCADATADSCICAGAS